MLNEFSEDILVGIFKRDTIGELTPRFLISEENTVYLWQDNILRIQKEYDLSYESLELSVPCLLYTSPYELEEEKLEISEFYDFSSTYEELDREAHQDEGEWEDVDDVEDAADGEDSDNEELPQHILYDDGVELHLPTGVKVGHRTLQRYYRQNLKPERELTEGQGTLVAADTRHFAAIFDRQQHQLQKTVWQTEVKDKKRDDKRAAKFVNNQPYYRDQLLQ